MSFSGATSPRMEYSPSTTTRRLRSPAGSRSSFVRRLSGELCRKATTCDAVWRVALVKPLGELSLECFVERQRAVGRSGACRSGAVFEKRVPRGRHHRRLEG